MNWRQVLDCWLASDLSSLPRTYPVFLYQYRRHRPTTSLSADDSLTTSSSTEDHFVYWRPLLIFTKSSSTDDLLTYSTVFLYRRFADDLQIFARPISSSYRRPADDLFVYRLLVERPPCLPTISPSLFGDVGGFWKSSVVTGLSRYLERSLTGAVALSLCHSQASYTSDLVYVTTHFNFPSSPHFVADFLWAKWYFTSKTSVLHFRSPPFEGLYGAYDVHVRCIGKCRIVNFLLVLIKLFGWVLRLRRYWRKYIENRRVGQYLPNFRLEGNVPTDGKVRSMNALQLSRWRFHTKKLCSRLSSSKVRFYTENSHFAFLSPLWGAYGQRLRI